MAKNVITVAVLANTKGLQDGFSSASGSIGGLARVAAAAATAVAAVTVAIGVKAVASASALEQAMGGLSSVFKESTDEMTKFAQGAAQSVGLAQSDYAQLATVLGSQLKNMGVAATEVSGQTNDLVKLGADLAAQFGGSTSDAVSALSSLLRGERDPIERYGVSINEARLQAKLAEMGLAGLTGEALTQAKAQATLALLYEQTADAQGAFARESNTLAGQQERLRAGTENLYAALGTALLPAATAVTAALGQLVATVQGSDAFASFTAGLAGASASFAGFITGLLDGSTSIGSLFSGIDFGALLVNVFSGLIAMREALVTGIISAIPAIVTGLVAAVPQVVSGISMLLASMVSLIASSAPILLGAGIQLFQGLLGAVTAVLPQLISTLTTLIPQLVTTLVSMVPQLLAGALQLFQGLISALVVAIPLVVTALLGMLPSLVSTLLGMIPMILTTAIQLFQSLVAALPVILPQIVTALVETLPVLIETILGMIPGILDAAINLFMAIVESLPVILPLLITSIINLLPVIITTVIGMIPRLLEAAVKLFTGLVTAIPKIIPKLIPALLGLLPTIISAIIGMVPSLVNSGVQLIQGLIRGIGQMAGAVGNALINIAKGAIGGFLSFLGIKSPSRLFMQYGGFVVAGLAKGLSDSGPVDRAMAGLTSAVSGSFEPSLTIDGSLSGGGSSAAGNTYHITVQAVAPGPEVGRSIVAAIREYEDAGGRR